MSEHLNSKDPELPAHLHGLIRAFKGPDLLKVNSEIINKAAHIHRLYVCSLIEPSLVTYV